MTQDQLKRANGVAFPIVMVILGYTTLTLLGFALTGGDAVSSVTYIQLVASIVAITVCIILYVRNRDTKRCGVGIITATLIVYVLQRLIGNSEDTCMYAFPIIFTTLTYLDKRMVGNSTVTVVAANIIRWIKGMITGTTGDSNTVFIGIGMCILVMIAANRVIRLMIKFNEENTQEIVNAAKRQEESNNMMITVADNITNHFGKAMDMMSNLKDNFDKNHDGMENIVESAESTAEAIQNETEICSKIKEQTDYADEVTDIMKERSEKVKKTATDGVNAIHELRQHSEGVSSSSKIVEDAITELTAKVKEVENFVGTILSISNQTNLLALNASIEAARAGAAGKGFSVVAEEIRKLSEDTKEASNHITSIIQDLNFDANRANESIANAVESVEKQGELIGSTEANFEQVANEIVNLSKEITDTDNIIKEILASANIINESISQLSANSEEVVATANESLSNSNALASDLRNCKSIFESINQLALDLKNR